MKPYVKKFWETVVPQSVWKRLLRTSVQLVPADFSMQYGLQSMGWSIGNLKKLGYSPKTVIDVGAYKGEWTLEVRKIFPDAAFLMVEPQPERAAGLRSLAEKSPNVYFESALAGAEDGTKTAFNVLKTGSSVYTQRYKAKVEPETIALATQSLDTLVQKNNLPGDYFLKLDVQGYELEVLRGATQVLEATEMVLMEVNVLNYLDECPLFAEVVAFMQDRNYVLFDVAELGRKSNDGALSYVDALFTKETSPIRARVNL